MKTTLFEEFVNNSSDYYWSVDTDLKITYANKSFSAIIEQYSGKPLRIGDTIIQESFGKEYNQKWVSYYQKAFKGELTEVIESLYNRESGLIDHGLVKFTLIYDKQGNVNHLNCHNAKIDSSFKLKNEIQELLDSSSDVICTISESGQFLHVSKSSEKNWGYSPLELIGKHHLEIFEKEIDNTIKSLLKNKEEVFTVTNKIVDKDGKYVYLKTLIKWDKNNNCIHCIAKNVTDQIDNNRQLKLFGKAILNARDAILVNEIKNPERPDPKIIYANPSFEKLLGYEMNEINGQSPYLFTGKRTDKAKLDSLGKQLSKGQLVELNTAHYTKEGKEIWVDIRTTPILDDDGKFKYSVSIIRDVTERRLDSTVINLINDVDQIINTEFNFHDTMTQVCQLISKKLSLSIVEFWIQEPEKNMIQRFNHCTNDQAGKSFAKKTLNLESVPFHRSGIGEAFKYDKLIFWEEDHKKSSFKRIDEAKKAGLKSFMILPLKAEGETIGVITAGSSNEKILEGFNHEVLKKIKGNLASKIYWKRLTDELKMTFQYTPELIGIINLEGKFLKINESGCKLLETHKNEILGKSLTDFLPSMVFKEDGDFLNQITEIVPNHSFTTRHIIQDGSIRWMKWNSKLERDKELVFLTAKDISYEKKIEELLEDAISLAKIGGWEIDLTNETVSWSDSVHAIHETDPQTFIPTLEAGISFYRKDHQHLVNGIVQNTIKNGEPFDFEAPIITNKGKEAWVRCIGQSEFMAGNCIRLWGSFQDISDRKKAEIQIVQAYDEKNDILTSIGDAFIAFDENWNTSYWNKPAEMLFDIKKEEILGENIWTKFPELEGGKYYKNYHKAKETNKVVRFEDHVEEQNLWIDVSVHPSQSGVSVYFKDITFKKQADIRLKEANERFKLVTEATTDAIWDWDIRQDKTYLGRGFENLLLGAEDENLDFMKRFSIIHAEDLNEVKDSLQSAIDNPDLTKWKKEYRIIVNTNEIKNVIDQGLIMRDKKGTAIRMIGAVSDISYLKEYEKELNELNKSLEEKIKELQVAYDELEQFSFIASHDLQEPLRMISSFMDRLKTNYEADLDERGKKYIHFANDGAKRMKQIILDLLDYSRAGKFTEEPQLIDLNDVLADYQILRRRIIEEKKASISFSSLPKVKALKTPLVQVIHNLLDNAMKYTEKNTTPQIEIEVKEKNNLWEFSIKDNGIGIDPKYQDKIFIIFQRLHDREEYEGTGLGLSLVKKIVQTWGGKLWLDSTLGKGSTFYFTVNKQP